MESPEPGGAQLARTIPWPLEPITSPATGPTATIGVAFKAVQPRAAGDVSAPTRALANPVAGATGLDSTPLRGFPQSPALGTPANLAGIPALSAASPGASPGDSTPLAEPAAPRTRTDAASLAAARRSSRTPRATARLMPGGGPGARGSLMHRPPGGTRRGIGFMGATDSVGLRQAAQNQKRRPAT